MDVGKAFRRALGGKRKPWIEKVRVEDLEREVLNIDNQIHMMAKTIEKLEEKKKQLFREGVGKSDIEKMLLAEKIKDVEAEIKMKMKEYNRLIKQRRALSNLIRLKKWESRLKEKGVWDKIRSAEPDKLIQMLSHVQFEEEQFSNNIEKIIEILGGQTAEVEVDEETKEIFDLWEKVEKSELTPEAAVEEVSIKQEEKEGKEEEKEAE